MNMLVDLLPEEVEIDGMAYKINTNFRNSILFELMVFDDEIPDREKVINALSLYYPVWPENLKEAVDKILWFYKCGKEENEYARAVAQSRRSQQKVYSFEHDDDYIYSAFLTQYGVDLNKIKYMHWWKFRAMFNSLTDDHEFVKIMGYRAVELTSDMPKERKAFYKKMKKIHELPRPKTEQEKHDKLTEVLMKGGDLAGLI